MKVLITGANGYIGTRLLPILLDKGYDVVCLVRDKQRFRLNNNLNDKVTIVAGDLLKEQSIETFPTDIDVAYYLVNSKLCVNELSQLAALSAHNFVQALNKTNCKHIIFLSKGLNYMRRSEYFKFRQCIAHILAEAKAKLSVCPVIPNWHLMWPLNDFVFKKILSPLTTGRY